jgi:hypothetical protein
MGGDGAAAEQHRERFDPLWPIVPAVGSFLALTIVLRIVVPRRESIGPHWFVPVTEMTLLVVLVVAAHLEIWARWLRAASLVLILLLSESRSRSRSSTGSSTAADPELERGGFGPARTSRSLSR